jgi:hypothetical protein
LGSVTERGLRETSPLAHHQMGTRPFIGQTVFMFAKMARDRSGPGSTSDVPQILRSMRLESLVLRQVARGGRLLLGSQSYE